jgi:hypothetical protein
VRSEDVVVYYKSREDLGRGLRLLVISVFVIWLSQVYLQQNKKKARAEGNSCHA